MVPADCVLEMMRGIGRLGVVAAALLCWSSLPATAGEALQGQGSVTKERACRPELVMRRPVFWPPGVKPVTGWAKIGFSVDSNGTPSDLKILDATGSVFGRIARDTVAQWRYRITNTDGSGGACTPFGEDRSAILYAVVRSASCDGKPIFRPAHIWPVGEVPRKGSVRVRFDVDRDGLPVNVDLFEASDPVIASMMALMIPAWRYPAFDPDTPDSACNAPFTDKSVALELLHDTESVVDCSPVPLYRTAPRWPKGTIPESGFAKVRFNVNADGVPTDLTLLEASNMLLGQIVLRAIARWRYRPEDPQDPSGCRAPFRNIIVEVPIEVIDGEEADSQ